MLGCPIFNPPGVFLVKHLKLITILSVFCVLFSGAAAAIDFTSHGYYRNRVEFTYDLDTQKSNGNATHNNDRFGLIAFNQMRLRLEPILKLNDFLSIHTQFDVLDNVVFGTNDTVQLDILSPVVGTVTLPAGAGSISTVGGAAGQNGSINVRRAWAEVLTPVGKLRFGRQPSNWGLGIFQNDGNAPQADFGDTEDRIMFVSQYQFGDGSAASFGALWDIAYEAQWDPRIQGLGGQIRDNGQDCNQWAGILHYERPEMEFGLFGGIRKRDGGIGTTMTATDESGAVVDAGIDGNTLVYFIDAYGEYTYREYNLKLEGVYIGGKMTTGLAINSVNLIAGMPNNGVIELPPDQDVRVFMAALEAGAKYKWGGEWLLQSGFAQGDATPLSQRITQYGFRPDYTIALMMFHIPLGTSPAIIPTGGPSAGQVVAGGLPITGNFINNAIYVAATYKHHFDFGDSCRQCNDFSAGLRVTTAWAQKNPVEIDFAALYNSPTLPAIESKGKWYGVECDLLVEGKFFEFLYTALEAGMLIPGSAYDINVNVIDPSSIITPIAYDKANPAYAARLTLMLEF